MRSFCYTTDPTRTNFGDDLNRWMWRRLLSEELEDPDDGILLCGIGTILGQRLLPPARHYVVVSSGVGYGAPPDGFGDANWSIVSVRGPLTARVLGLPRSSAVTDGAALLSLFPELRAVAEEERSGVLFMPHHEILPMGDWREICRRAGVEFLDPLLPSEVVIDRMRRAKLVLADAMHAAIVADVVRIPWVPLVTSNRINSFKWLDWSLTMGLPYRPITLPSPTLLEDVHNRTLHLYGQAYSIDTKTEEAAYQDFLRNKQRKEQPDWEAHRVKMKRLVHNAPNKVLGHPALSGLMERDREHRMNRIAETMQAAAESRSYLSDERNLTARTNELLGRLDEVRKVVREKAGSIQ